jgi:Ca2+-binding EF-hand superfamily protein
MGRGANGLPPMFSVFDTDKDGVLSSAEMNGATAALLKLDVNHDGKIEAAEFCPAAGRGWGRGTGSCPGAMSLFDTNKDGSISTAEAQAAPATLKALDTDHDGKVTGGGACPRRGQGGPGWAGRGCRWSR